jgi:hypothetical protein
MEKILETNFIENNSVVKLNPKKPLIDLISEMVKKIPENDLDGVRAIDELHMLQKEIHLTAEKPEDFMFLRLNAAAVLGRIKNSKDKEWVGELADMLLSYK